MTEDGNFTSKLNQVVLTSPRGALALMSAVNIFLCITACLGNTPILVSLHRVSSVHSTKKSFLRYLAVSDLSVGLIVQPLYATLIMSLLIKMDIKMVFMISQVRDAFGWCLCGVSTLTSTAISVDRLLALLLGLRCRHVVTLRRVRVVIFCFWFINVSLGSTRISSRDIAFKAVSALLPLSLVISIFCYTRIFFRRRHQQVQVPQGQANEGEIPVNMARYKKLVSSIL